MLPAIFGLTLLLNGFLIFAVAAMRFGAGVLNMIPGPAVAIIACLAAGFTSSCLRSAMLAVSPTPVATAEQPCSAY
ncbi:hypothetical protein ABW13_00380 [Pluralibacter gergoviae]|nr:hypothetical protein ABW13_00380 [Pluralibacter gergoviae]